MHDLKNLREKLMDELITISHKDGEMTTSCLDTIYKLVEAVKGIDTIDAMEDSGNYSRGSSYRGRTRDSMGRYSGIEWPAPSHYRPRMSRASGLEDELERLVEESPIEKVRAAAETLLTHMGRE